MLLSRVWSVGQVPLVYRKLHVVQTGDMKERWDTDLRLNEAFACFLVEFGGVQRDRQARSFSERPKNGPFLRLR